MASAANSEMEVKIVYNFVKFPISLYPKVYLTFNILLKTGCWKISTAIKTDLLLIISKERSHLYKTLMYCNKLKWCGIKKISMLIICQYNETIVGKMN